MDQVLVADDTLRLPGGADGRQRKQRLTLRGFRGSRERVRAVLCCAVQGGVLRCRRDATDLHLADGDVYVGNEFVEVVGDLVGDDLGPSVLIPWVCEDGHEDVLRHGVELVERSLPKLAIKKVLGRVFNLLATPLDEIEGLALELPRGLGNEDGVLAVAKDEKKSRIAIEKLAKNLPARANGRHTPHQLRTATAGQNVKQASRHQSVPIFSGHASA